MKTKRAFLYACTVSSSSLRISCFPNSHREARVHLLLSQFPPKVKAIRKRMPSSFTWKPVHVEYIISDPQEDKDEADLSVFKNVDSLPVCVFFFEDFVLPTHNSSFVAFLLKVKAEDKRKVSTLNFNDEKTKQYMDENIIHWDLQHKVNMPWRLDSS